MYGLGLKFSWLCTYGVEPHGVFFPSVAYSQGTGVRDAPRLSSEQGLGCDVS